MASWRRTSCSPCSSRNRRRPPQCLEILEAEPSEIQAWDIFVLPSAPDFVRQTSASSIRQIKFSKENLLWKYISDDSSGPLYICNDNHRHNHVRRHNIIFQTCENKQMKLMRMINICLSMRFSFYQVLFMSKTRLIILTPGLNCVQRPLKGLASNY